MRVVVTGGAGFIGANLLHHWARNHPEDELLTLDALTYAGHRPSLRPLEKARQLRFLQGDIADAAVVDRALRGADLVVHLAAESHVDRSIEDAAPFLRTNVLGTHVLLEAARRHDVGRFLAVSTDEVFGSLPERKGGPRFGPTSPYDPKSPYAASKAASDHLVRAYAATYGLGTVITNCGNNYGPYQHPEKLIPLAITRLLTGRTMPLYGDGRNVRDWIHVEDHVRALDAAAHRGRPGATYLLGADGERTNREVLEALARIFARDPAQVIETVADRPGHDRRYAIDARSARRQLRWHPRYEFSRGLAATVRWYRENEPWWRPLLTAVPARSR